MKIKIKIMFMFLCIAGCEEREKIQLKGGYEAIRIYGDAHSLVKPDRKILVMANVVRAIDNDTYIIGLREEAIPKASVSKRLVDQPYGYFIYNKINGTLRLGLSYEELAGIVNVESVGLIF
ncbi:hypothetical protein L2755_21900 [Shewanella abyssi]|uniref:hypothetical protein n=1 Tax=Shewanella abyssi TaxID=311789 RepID=UPI00200D55F0|nr:hypothetical protein [Shewanella abyssi]MCL1052240.1 hypothetical protein [Shewanella abyssi]